MARVVLHPLVFSRTELQVNPHPLFVAWGGAAVGVVVPLVVSAVWRCRRWRGWPVLQFFAGFCLVANGIYLGVVSLIPNTADPGDLMREGCPRWVLIAFGIVAFLFGLFLWNGLGSQFGLGKAAGTVDRLTATVTFTCLVVLISIELMTYAG